MSHAGVRQEPIEQRRAQRARRDRRSPQNRETGSRPVLHVINSLAGGGAERIVVLLLREFQRTAAKHEHVHLVLLDRLPHAYAPPADIELTTLDANGRFLPSVLQLCHVLRENKPRLVVSHLARANFAAVLASNVFGVPCIIVEHVNTSSHFGSRTRYAAVSKWLVRRLYPRATAVVAVSQGVADDLKKHYAVPVEKLHVIKTPFDIAYIEAEARKPPAIRLPKDFLVAVGRLTRNKNFGLLLRAFRKANLSLELLIIGEGEERATLEREVQELQLENRVHLPGFVQNPYAIMVQARGFVSSSNAEGFPVAASEAMILGCPLLMTDCPSGPAELLGGAAPAGAGLVRGEYGLLCPLDDVESLAEGLRALAEPDIRTLAERGRARMAAHGVANVAAAHMRLMTAVMNLKSGFVS